MMTVSILRLISLRLSPGPNAMPALLTMMSSTPTSRSIVANIAFTWALSATSAWMARPPPEPFISITVCFAVSRESSLTMTCAPSSAKSSEIARPSPEPPPVTSATLSWSFIDCPPHADAHTLGPRLQVVKQRAEILGLDMLESCILGVGTEARAVDDFIDTITRTSIFSGLSREDLARVAGKLDEVRVAAGTVIIRQAEPGDALYVVQTGGVEVLREEASAHVRRIAMLGPRECFGEIALFTEAPRSASVVALVETSLLRMSKDSCEQLVAQCPPFSLHVCRLLGQRLVERGRELVSSRIGRDAVLDDLFESQAPLTRQLLLRASVLETVTPDTLAAILADPVDVGKLADLAERYPRLVQGDGEHAWTFHAGLRTFLLARLAREESPDGAAALHARAAAHFEESGDWSRAVDHYLGARKLDEAVRMLERHGDTLLGQESPQRLLVCFDALPPATLRARFHLLRLRAKALSLHGQTDGALRDCRELLTQAHVSSLGAIATAFGYHVGLAEVHRTKGRAAEAQRSLRDGLAVLEPSAARRAAPPALRLPRATGRARRSWGVRRRWLYALPALAAGAIVWYLDRKSV